MQFHRTVLSQDLLYIVELVATVDTEPAFGLANWTMSRKYVINRVRTCNDMIHIYIPCKQTNKQAST